VGALGILLYNFRASLAVLYNVIWGSEWFKIVIFCVIQFMDDPKQYKAPTVPLFLLLDEFGSVFCPKAVVLVRFQSITVV